MHTSIIGIEVFHVANLVLQVILMSTVEVISVNVLCQRNACKKNNSEAKIVVSRELGEMISYLLNNIRNKCQRIFFFCQSVGFSKLFEGDVPNFQRMWYFAMEVSDVKWRILYTQTNTIKDMKVERVANKPNIHVWRRKNCRDERKLRGLDKRDRERKEWDASKNENRKILDYWIEGKNKVKIRWNNNIDHNINSLWVELNNWVSCFTWSEIFISDDSYELQTKRELNYYCESKQFRIMSICCMKHPYKREKSSQKRVSVSKDATEVFKLSIFLIKWPESLSDRKNVTI